MALALLIDKNDEQCLDSLIGQTFSDYTITSDDIENNLQPALTWVNALLNKAEAEFYLEQRCIFPTIAGAYGTCDLLVRVLRTIHVVDFKFGSGVRVLALSPDGDEDIINAQLKFYAAAARHSLPKFFAGVEDIVLTIVQPQSIEPDAEMVSSVAVAHAELDEFITAYRAACEEALSEAPRLERGPHCRFCPAKPICPAHTGPLLDLAQFTAPTLRDSLIASSAAPPAKEAYLELIAKGLDLIDAVKDLRVTLHDQAKAALENGNLISGYTLSAGRADRHWRDDERTAIAALKSLGLTHDDIIAETMRSPKQVEIRAKARGLKVQDVQKLVVSRRSGTSLMRSENAHVPAPAPRRDEIVRSFSAALTAFERS
jgi:hypothetical protein